MHGAGGVDMSDRCATDWVPVGPVDVFDAPAADVIVRLVEGIPNGVGHVAYALHVGAFSKLDDMDFVEVMNRGDTVYADGHSVVLLAEIAGATSIERSPTTDIGWDVLRAARQRLGRPPRVALIGGPPGLAERAAAVIERDALGTSVATADGFQETYASVVQLIREEHVEIVFVGMGMPREALWVDRHRTKSRVGLGDDLRRLVRVRGR